MTAIDPNDPKHHSRPLWCVFGHSFEPSIIPCILRAYNAQHVLLSPGQPGRVVVWGYSVWRRKPGYRTYGVSLLEFSKRHSLEPMFFDSQDEAIEKIRSLTTVPVSLMKKIEIERASETGGGTMTNEEIETMTNEEIETMTNEEIETLRLECEYWRICAKELPKAEFDYFKANMPSVSFRPESEGIRLKAEHDRLVARKKELYALLKSRGVEL